MAAVKIGRPALIGLALLAFGWSLTALKVVPQGVLLVLPLVALAIDRLADGDARRVAFVLTTSAVALGGYLFAASTLAAAADGWLFPTAHRAMPVGPLLLGAAVGLALFALTYFVALKPAARDAPARRFWLVAILVTGLVAWAIDRLPALANR
ncbi:hypothetical protein J421_3673 [Gemmatirosa kalamazoonensis]|uniref:Uncharacterized protein n=1 Tax=Gemmatirosa kalamazoonensis TaxID=861299 RepID=W0RLN1_9BACT|nr:hypothetical protein [Gemmatirosa kalamazoonensis]AHG91210.1 hypothetical protein J421_3673 [Gemmatirosa kalamazoonensis]